ncbi:hypothetical protein ACPPVO_22090 [Dactylosporangium sp. McL0621]|uniref:hypothetical protein n=1 Tax=Dactylosporangium sp. McL0621 TaxID=3415678 RepID=UPI003CECFD3E
MTSTSTSNVASTSGVPQRGQPGPFPVIVVRPATATIPAYLRRHRGCRRGANQLAAALTEQCRAVLKAGPSLDDDIWLDLDDPRRCLLFLPDRQVVEDLIRQAPVVAAAPPPGTVRIGRDLQGRPVVVLLHGPHWSLVLRRGHPDPAAWVFLGVADPCALRLHGGRELSVDWDEMTRDVYRILTGGTG